jgi:hypothetical protein
MFRHRWLTVILITPEKFGADREFVRLRLEKENIESRPVFSLIYSHIFVYSTPITHIL